MATAPPDAVRTLRRVACALGLVADMDPVALYGDGRRGGFEQAYHRHLWIWLARTAFDLVEADMARALDCDHDTIANACHKIEDALDADPSLEDALRDFGAKVIELVAIGDCVRTRIDAALARQRKRRAPA